jgi:hypothetical protein
VRHRSRAALLAGVLAAATTLTPAWPADAGSGPWTHVTTWATVHDHRIDEASGISRSTYSRSLVFLHNDSGDTARFFAVGSNGRTKAVFRVRDVQARDWEDMATGPHHTLWFGDIGDNAENRSEIAVIRVREPRELRSHAVNGRVFRFEYSDGPHNAEALLVRPRTGRLYVVTKVREGAGVYRAPKNLSSSEVNVLTRIADVPLFVTGGDFAPNGRHLVLRTYHDAYLYARFGGSARKVSLPEQQQGEAIGYTRDGRAVKVASEGLDQPIFRVAR